MSTTFDFVVLGIAIFIFFRGMIGGIGRGLLDIVAVLASLYGAHYTLRKLVFPWAGTVPVLADFILLLIVWGVLYLFLAFGARLLFKIVKIQFVPPIDQVGGVMAGVAKIILLMSVFYALIFPIPGGAVMLEDSVAVRVTRPFWRWITFLPDPILPAKNLQTERVGKMVDAVRKVLEKELNLKELPPEIEKTFQEIPKKLK